MWPFKVAVQLSMSLPAYLQYITIYSMQQYTQPVVQRPGYGLACQGFKSRQGLETFSSPKTPRPAFYSMDTGALSRGYNGGGVTLTIHLRPVPRLRKVEVHVYLYSLSVSSWAGQACLYIYVFVD